MLKKLILRNAWCSTVICAVWCVQGGPKNWHNFFLYALTLPNINQFLKLFHCQNQEKNWNNAVAKDTTAPKCITTLPCEMLVSQKQQLKTRRLL